MSESYRIYYENQKLPTEEPGVEISLQKDIVWENRNSQCEQWKALSVFACQQGLVLELAKQVTPEQYLAFYEKWKDVDEEQITDQQREQIEAESPLGECPTVLLTCNGKELQSDWTRGMGWYPSEILEKLEEKPIYGEESFILHTGDQIEFLHPVTGQTYRLDALEMEEEEMPVKQMPDDEPIGIFFIGKLTPKKTERLAIGNLHYVPDAEVAWVPVFKVKDKEDITVELQLA